MWSRRNASPVLFLSINGKHADDLLRALVSFSYKKSVRKAAQTTMVFRNDERKLADDKRFYSNVRWYFRWGYLNDLSPVITGIVRKIEPEYSDRRILTVTLFDDLVSLAKHSSARSWGRVLSSVVAQKIAAQYGMQAVVDRSDDLPAKAFVQPASVSDLQYLRDLAADIDFELYVDGVPPVLYYRRKPYDHAPHPFKLVYYDDPSPHANVRSFHPSVTSLGPLSSGAAKTSAKKGKGEVESATEGKGSALGGAKTGFDVVMTPGDNGNPASMSLESLLGSLLGSPGSSAAAGRLAAAAGHPTGGGKGVTLSAASGASTRHLSQTRRAQLLDRANKAESQHLLTPSIHPGRVYEWAGLEASLNRKWYCSGISASISGTSSTLDVQWKRNAGNKGKKKSKNAASHSEDGGKGKGADGDSSTSPYVLVNADSGKQWMFPGQPNSTAPPGPQRHR